MDPYAVLQISKNYTLQDLKTQYKKMIVQYHPDLSQDIRSTPMFQALTEAYRKLLKEYQAKQKNLEHYQLKERFHESIKTPAQKVNASVLTSLNSAKFDSNKFNKLYEQYAYKDEVENEGYGDWLKSNKDNMAPTQRNAIINYGDPEPLLASKVLGKYTELGKDKIEDFTNYDIGYMDLRKALTTTSIVDESKVKMPKNYKNIQQLENDRSAMPMTMTPEQYAVYAEKLAKEKEAEEKRRQFLQQRDQKIQDFYSKTHSLMLSHLGK